MENLKVKAFELRKDVVKMIMEGKAGHIGGDMSSGRAVFPPDEYYTGNSRKSGEGSVCYEQGALRRSTLCSTCSKRIS